MQNVKLITNQTNLFPEDPDIKLATVQECLDWCDSVDEIEVDTETIDSFLVGGIFTLQLGNFDVQYVIDCTTVDVKLFRGPLENPKKLKLLQNAKYDLKYFMYFGIEVVNVYDTMLAECVLTRRSTFGKNPEKPEVGLKALGLKYVGIDIDKEIRGKIYQEGLTKRVILYAAGDVEFLGKIKEKQLLEIHKWELERTLELENKFIITLARIEYIGFGLDKLKFKEVEEFNNKRKIEIQEQINCWILDNKELVPEYIEQYQDLFTPLELRARTRIPKKTKSKTKSNYEFIFDSSKKTIPFLKKLGIDTIIKDKETNKDKDSCDIKLLDRQRHKSTFIPIFIEYKETLKLISTYGQKFLKHVNKLDNRIHCNYWPLVNTGRISCKDPKINWVL